MNDIPFEYAGFWPRLGATLVDTVLLFLFTMPVMFLVYGELNWESDDFILGGWDVILNWICPLLATVAFWIYRSATPGKIVFGLEVLDVKTGGKLTVSTSIIRYFSYYLSAIPLCLGFIWICFNSKRQGWHDLIAGTIVTKKSQIKEAHKIISQE
ncbi:RDD family protein [Vibrio sp. OCN044]|uniref:RDD family protein n=1 Tax=Vibrio tetraodonis subsp. pristinus TaxID=2695891 RepID=A0A6L8LVN4_9VIBR|nr:RDD family protein [Vibrio tetraodonis]MYM60157.1 RDD family protein [Vibrio tetraodonis subsp. pristinus]